MFRVTDIRQQIDFATALGCVVWVNAGLLPRCSDGLEESSLGTTARANLTKSPSFGIIGGGGFICLLTSRACPRRLETCAHKIADKLQGRRRATHRPLYIPKEEKR